MSVAEQFVAIAHRVVWCTMATVDRHNRPRSRIVHPVWEIREGALHGLVATRPTPLKLAHLAHAPYVSCTYWDPAHDVATADAAASWHNDDETRTWLWDKYKNAPAPVGYDPSIVPGWTSPTAPSFGALRLEPTSIRVIKALDFANAQLWRG